MLETFKTPPSDGSFLLPHWMRYNARHSPDHPLFVYGSAEAEVKVVTWSKATNAFARAAQIISEHLPESPEKARDAPLVIGILANLDSLTYYTLAAGILTAGCTAFLISTRNSSAAVSHLLKQTGTHRLFVSADSQTQGLASAALASALRDGHRVELLPVPTAQQLYFENKHSKDLELLPEYPKRSLDSPAFIMHSSGSTAFPKAITLSHRMLIQLGMCPVISGVDLSKVRFSVHALPVFHAMAFSPLAWATYTGVALSFFPPQVPPVIPSPGNILDAAVACRCTFLFCVPLFIELWGRSSQDREKLKVFDAVFAGGPLNKAIGDELSRGGVSLTALYGTTEIGPACMMLANNLSTEWDWFNARPDIRTVYLPQDDGSDTFELAFVEGPSFTPAIVNMEIDGKRAFASSDLVIRHPTNPTKFKIYGRKDDQLMLSTGEKTNPEPLEAIICRHPLVQAAVMFGRGRLQNGILIQPAKGHEIDANDKDALTQFRNDIWPAVEEANAYAPSHSKLYKEMIIVTHPSQPFEMTAKLIPRRPAVLEAYKSEIQAVYIAAEASTQTGIAPPSEWSPDQVYKYVRNTVHYFMGVQVGDDDNIFLNGGDSLKATFIRNSLVKALRQTNKVPTQGIAQGFVYSHPSIARLATQLLAIVGTTSMASEDNVSHKLREMDQMVAEFSANFVQHHVSASHPPSSGEVILLTGTTGALGSQLLAHLVSLADVSHIYALNRRDDSKPLQLRQSEALRERGLDVSIIDSPKVTLIEGDAATEGLKIPASLLQEIRDSISLIIHNAWRVNFNLTLESFRPLITGVRNLINLALGSPRSVPPRFIFSSSVGVFRNHKGSGRPLETSIEDPKMVLGAGYSESKFVAERILERAARFTPLRPIIVRIGQLTSNSSGAWNSGDWVPAIVRSANVLGVLPARDDSVAWMPLDIAAQAIVDFRTSEYQYLHLAHPKSTPWNTLFTTFASCLNVPLVTWTEWLSRLETTEVGPERNPAAHLLDFFRACSPLPLEDTEAPGSPLLDLRHALRSSSTLASPVLPGLSGEDAQRWMGYWKYKGLLTV